MDYDPGKRPWYRISKIESDKLTISSTYLDAFGAGKVVSLSRPVFQHKPVTCMPIKKMYSSLSNSDAPTVTAGPGCPCTTSSQCAGFCYKGSCSAEEIEGVVSSDLTYASFESMILNQFQNSSDPRACGKTYNGRETKCYIVNGQAELVYDSSFSKVSLGNTREYQSVGLGHKEPAVMRDLVYKYKFFSRSVTMNLKGYRKIKRGP